MVNYSEKYLFWRSVAAIEERIFTFDGTIAHSTEPSSFAVYITSPDAHFRLIKKYANNRPLEKFILLATAFRILLTHYRYNSSTVIIDVPLFMKNASEAKESLYVSLILPDVKECTIQQAIEIVNTVVVNSYTHQDFSLAGLFTDGEGTAPATNILLKYSALHTIHDAVAEEKYDLIIDMKEDEEKGDLQLEYHYNAGKYETWFIERFADGFKRVIASFDKLGRAVSEVVVMSASELEELLTGLNNTSYAVPQVRNLYQLFEDQVRRTPDHPAVVFEGNRLTYAVLDHEVRRLSNVLVRDYHQELEENKCVGVYLDRSHFSVIAFLAIARIGAIYLPIDPGYPADRVRHFIEDSGLRMLLTTTDYLFELGMFNRQIITIDAYSERPAEEAVLFEEPVSATPLYIIYTSGSSGTPKGVLVDHQSVVNLATDHIVKLELSPAENILQSHSHAFDASILDFVMTLCSGATLTIVPNKVINNSERFVAFLEENDISLMTVSPSFLSNLGYREFKTLRTLITGGEQAILKDARYYLRQGKRYYNAYGPTEATVNTTLCRFEDIHGPNPVPLGRPGINKSIFILNADMKMLPKGVVGEICIAGAGVAIEYLNNPSLTAEKFIPNPFRAGERLYRTGDFGRWLTTGDLAFHGRKDDQIKIRGFRIEPGEIEKVICLHEMVDDAVVLVTAEKTLVAFYKVKHTAEKDFPGTDISLFLKQKLPAHMLPAGLKQIERIPLTVEGKADRRLLLQLYESSLAQLRSDVTPPQTGKEALIVELWEDILGRKAGRESNFFQMGGDSLKAIQFSSRMHAAGFKVEIQDVFDAPVLMHLAARLVETGEKQTYVLQPGDYPLTPIQKEIIANGLGHYNRYNQSVALWLHHQWPMESLVGVLNNVFAAHSIFKTRFKRTNEVVQPCLTETNHFFDITEIYPVAGKETELLLEETAESLHAAMDPETGPLVKMAFVRLEPSPLLLIIIHHFVIDTVSWGILLEDLDKRIKEESTGRLSAPSHDTVPFSIWAEKAVQSANEPPLLSELDYWKQQHVKAPDTIPCAGSDSGGLFAHMKCIYPEIDDELCSLLIERAGLALGTDVQDLMLTALAKSVWSHWSFSSLQILLEAHGRENIVDGLDVSRTIGWFSSFYPFNIHFDSAASLEVNIVKNKDDRRLVPLKGAHYPFIKHYTAAEHKRELDFTMPQISFNYFGVVGKIKYHSFEVAARSYGHHTDPRMKRVTPIAFTALIVEGRLKTELAYDRCYFSDTEMEAFSNTYKAALAEIISYCSAIREQKVTPGDLTFKGLTLDDLETMFN